MRDYINNYDSILSPVFIISGNGQSFSKIGESSEFFFYKSKEKSKSD